MGFGLIILISSFVFFKILDILVITKSLNKSLSKITLGKMNLILEPTSLEFNQNGRKRIVFKSQIAKCILKSDIIFLVEKNQKNLPMKINKNEMTEGSFEKLIDELKLLKIIKK
ncbi:hypothetical protein [Aquimarina sp. 2201CG14-23]|uniref:hypothetical protein n=1 Tax=Aquimarina mycalae TaxID=3040073 RepID=UPI0024781CA4|nr:hypothetical protein [Aquimarina sp. 2201CG14-23]MDH7444961.1 hypothetical protein [Aquimarina sp. 2201CG14-23]